MGACGQSLGILDGSARRNERYIEKEMIATRTKAYVWWVPHILIVDILRHRRSSDSLVGFLEFVSLVCDGVVDVLLSNLGIGKFAHDVKKLESGVRE